MTTTWQTRFEDAVKAYFGIPADAEISIDEDCTYYEGCPTCGGDYEWEVNVWWYDKPTKKYITKTYNGKMIDFINSLD